MAVLEHDLFGIKPQPGTAAALSIAMRGAGTCLQHDPIDTTELGHPRPTGMCQRCGVGMLLDETGKWTVP
ncbi:hypothetical protein EF906_08825 [Streptomyces sp. WAC08241]|nr:hypothetical protein EF906_08825 [Streptomyces sp. WAC08241]